jgi:hypothetical protein
MLFNPSRILAAMLALGVVLGSVRPAGAWSYVLFSSPSGGHTNYVAPQQIALSGDATEYSELYGSYTLVTSVVIRADGVAIGDADLQPAGEQTLWSFTWDSPPPPPATIKLTAVATGQGGETATGEVSIAISAQNIPPTALPASARTVEGTPVFFAPWYLHPDAVQTCVFEVVSQPVGGSVTVEERDADREIGGPSINYQTEGSIQGFCYRPADGFIGSDAFLFRISDGYDVSNVATATLTVVTNTPPVARNVSAAAVAGAAAGLSIYPSYTDPDLHVQSIRLVVVTPPAHGALAVTNSIYGQPLFFYSVPTDYLGVVSFAYRVNDGMVDSNVATGTVTIISNTPPVALSMRATTTPATTVAITAGYTDADVQSGVAQRFAARVTGAPARGVVVASGLRFLYTPEEGFASGVDTFRFVVSDGMDESGEAECRVRVRPWRDRSGALVLVVAHAGLYANVAHEVDRLVLDLSREGYTARLRIWPSSGTSVSNLWAYLRQEYEDPDQWLVGSVLVGSLPKPKVTLGGKSYYTDQVYWNLCSFQTDVAPSRQDIWVSRIIAENTKYGSEAALVRRALDANHYYRTGASRLPFTAFYFINPEWWNSYAGGVTNLLRVWPALETRGAAGGGLRFAPERTDLAAYAGADAFVRGGELLDETSHGNQDGYMASGGWFTRDALFRVIAQQRVSLVTSCSSGAYGGIVNQTLFTRGGGCVLAVGGSDINYVGDFTVASAGKAAFLDALAQGGSWGEAMLASYPFRGRERTLMYGDLSLGAMASCVSNAMPRIRSWSWTETAGRRVEFRVDADDADGVVSNVEWFCEGYDAGRRAPTGEGSQPSCVHTYPAPGTYTARVEVMDDGRARDWREFSVTVRGPPDQPMLVLSADNRIAALYVDGVGATPGPNATDWTRADVHFAAAVGCVAVKVLNDQPGTNSAGLLAKVIFPDGHADVSDSLWRAYDGTAGEPPDDMQGRRWYEPEYDDSAWPPAASAGAYGVSPWGRPAGLSLLDGASWIWAGDPARGVSPVYLRRTFVCWWTVDSDGDGVSDAAESIAGTDRTNSASMLLLGGCRPGGEGRVSGLSFEAVSNRAYTIWWRTSLTEGAWMVLPGYSNVWAPAGGVVSVLPTNAAPSRFYRLGVRR